LKVVVKRSLVDMCGYFRRKAAGIYESEIVRKRDSMSLSDLENLMLTITVESRPLDFFRR
jgi:hypothetical protein